MHVWHLVVLSGLSGLSGVEKRETRVTMRAGYMECKRPLSLSL